MNIKGKIKGAAKGATNVLLQTLRNMSPDAVEGRYKAMDEARANRDADMIRENFGNEENYRNTLGLDTQEGRDLFTPPYQKVMRSFADRLAKARQMITNKKQ